MHLRQWTESGACRSAAHCTVCQDAGDAGRRFRASTAEVFDGLPADGSPPPCPHNRKPASMLETFVRGAIGLAKAAIGADPAPDDVVKSRLATCATCIHWRDRMGGRCYLCGCFTHAKVRIAGEACPEGKWTAVTSPK